MKWTKFLITNQTPYYLHKIDKKDSVIIKTVNTNQIIIVLAGTSYITERFTNKEILPLEILTQNSMFTINKLNRNIYYEITPLETTYILNIEENIFQYKNAYIPNKIKNNYSKEAYKIINTIIKQKNITNRIIQLILLLLLHRGDIKGTNIHMPFQLSNKNIATLTGTSINTATKVMNKIYKTRIIKKFNKKLISISNVNHVKLE